MSEPAAERPARGAPPPDPGAKGGNVFQRKFGPLPGWGWALAAAMVAGGYLWWRNRQGASAAAADTGTPDTAAAVGDDVQGQLATIQTELQDLLQTEGQEGTATPDNSGSTPSGGSTTTFRHVSDGKATLNQIAKSRHTSVAHLVAVSQSSPESKDNLAKLLAWAKHPGTRRKGVVYYTSKGPAEGA